MKHEDGYGRFFEEVKKYLGFCGMRLPMKDDRVDYDEFEKVIDTFIANGFNHFDTAHSYEGGKSETDLRDCLTSRYPQDAQLKLFAHRQSRWLSF